MDNFITLNNSSYALFTLYIIILSFFAWKSRGQKHSQEFILGNRQVGLWGTTSSIIAVMRAGSALLFWFFFTSIMGIGALWTVIPFYLFLALMAFLAPRAHKLAKKHNYITVTDMLKERIGKHAGGWASFITIWVAFNLTAAQLFVGGTVLGSMLNIGTTAGTILTAFIVMSYVVIGGYMTIVRTDIFQVAIMAVLAIGMILFGKWPENNIIVSDLLSPDWNFVFGFFILGAITPAFLDVWQRFFSAKSGETAKKACLLAIAIDSILVLGIVLFIWNILQLTPDAAPATLFNDLFSQNIISPFMTALFGIFILSAMLSTMDNQVWLFTSVITKNILKIDVEKERKKFISILQISTVLILSILTILALSIEDALRFSIDTLAYQLVLSPLILYAVLSKGSDDTVDKGMSFSIILATFAYTILMVNGLFKENMLWFSIPLGIVSFAALTFWIRQSLKKTLNKPPSRTI